VKDARTASPGFWIAPRGTWRGSDIACHPLRAPSNLAVQRLRPFLSVIFS